MNSSPRPSVGSVASAGSVSNAKSAEEEKNLLLDRPMRGKSTDQIKRHSLEESIENKPIERSLYILTRGDDVQKISVIYSLPQLISLNSTAVYNRIIPKIKQDLPQASCEFQIAASNTFMILLKKSPNTSILQSVIQGIDYKNPNVAYAWTEALFGSMPCLPEIMIQNYVLPLAKQKSQPNSTVMSKVFCCKLMGEICTCTKFRILDVKRDILPIVIALCQDGHPDVRSQMCTFLPKVVAVIGNDQLEKTNLLSCIVDLANDGNLNVRAASIIAITSMLKILNAETSRTTLLPLIKTLCNKACDESLVTAMMLSDQFGNLMRGMPPISDQDVMFFIRIYKQLSLRGKQTTSRANASMEVTVRQRCAANPLGIMKLVLQSLPSQIHDVYSGFREHAIDPCYLVRRSAAAALADIANLLGNQNGMMKDEIVRLLRDEAIEVLDAIVPSISALFKSLQKFGTLSHETTSQTTVEMGKALIKCQTELTKRYNWRLIVEFMKQLEVLPLCMPSEYIHQNFTPILFDKLTYGKAKPVRNQAARTLVVFMRYNFKPTQTKWLREALIRQTAQSRSCHSRILYFYVCEAVLAVYSEKFFKEFFLAPCLQLAQDRIAIVRWKFMSFSSKLKFMVTLTADGQTKQKILDTIARLEMAERTRTGLDIIKIKKHEPWPKYSPEALREEELRVREENTTNLVRPAQSPPKPRPATPVGGSRVSIPSAEMRFLEQHFYIDAGIKLESIIGHDRFAKPDGISAQLQLDTSELIAIESCNITDDAETKLQDLRKQTVSKLTQPIFNQFGISQNKRHSVSLTDDAPSSNRSSENRRSLNLQHYSDSKIPVLNRTKPNFAAKDDSIQNVGDTFSKVVSNKHSSNLPVNVRRRQSQSHVIPSGPPAAPRRKSGISPNKSI